MKQRIKSIKEAYSMQPVTHEVCDVMLNDHVNIGIRKHTIKEIKLERVLIPIDKENNFIQNMYVGYNFLGQQKFMYHADSVNVEYFCEEPDVFRDKTGLELIADERAEQVKKHGYTPDHDRQHDGGQLLKAAMYAITSDKNFMQDGFERFESRVDEDRHEIVNLVRAGALVVAEIDRLLALEKETK